MRFRAVFYKDDDIYSQRAEFFTLSSNEPQTYFKGVSTADTMKGVGWSILSVTELLDGLIASDDSVDFSRSNANWNCSGDAFSPANGPDLYMTNTKQGKTGEVGD